MFLFRNEEFNILDKGGNVLIYGKRRVGKTSLIKTFLKKAKKKYLFYECIKSSLIENLEHLIIVLKEEKILKYDINFNNMYELFKFINDQNEKMIIVIDEYPYLKAVDDANMVDSLFQKILDNCFNIDFILCGSHIGMMKDMLKEGNPLYSRFRSVIELKEFNYIEASYFYSNKTNYEKIAYYSVFGGSPYINSYINKNLSLKENIIDLFLNNNSNIYTYADNLLISDAASQIGAKSILEMLGNNKLKYSELERKLDNSKTGKLAKQLKSLLELNLIKKVYPINKMNDNKKSYYEINDNVLRFYFTYIYKYKSILEILGPKRFYEEYIEKSLLTYISYRFEEQVRTYFSLRIKNNDLLGIKNIGTYYYDDPFNKINGEFDVVLEYEDGYYIYKVKYLKDKLKKDIINKEINQIRNIKGLRIVGIGFVNPNGFVDKIEGISYINGNDLYNFLENDE